MTPEDRTQISELAAQGAVDEALRRLRVLCDKGDGEAAYAIASWTLNESHGLKLDLPGATRLLDRALDAGYPPAFHDRAAVELRSTRKRRYKEAFGLLLVGSLLGDRDAQIQLVDFLTFGTGCFADPAAAKLIERFVLKDTSVD